MRAKEPDNWWKDKIPMIAMTCVFGIFTFFGQRLMKEHENTMVTLQENRTRILLLEAEVTRQRDVDSKREGELDKIKEELRKINR